MTLQKTFEELRKLPMPRNEKETEYKFVLPVLEELGWVVGTDILLEYNTGSGPADIALRDGKDIMVLIEVKAAQKSLVDSHVEQMLRYANSQSVGICVLTNGLEWWFYLPLEVEFPFAERRFARLNIEVKKKRVEFEFKSFLDKRAILSGEAKKKARRIFRANYKKERINKEVPKVLHSMLAEPDDGLVELLYERMKSYVYDGERLRPTKEQVKSALRDYSVWSVYEITRQQSSPTSNSAVTHSGTSSQAGGLITFLLRDKEYQAKSYREILRMVAEFLYEMYPTEFDQLLTMHTGKHPYVSRDKDDMKLGYCEIGSGYSKYYIYANLGATGIEKRARQFLRAFGYSDSDLVILPD